MKSEPNCYSIDDLAREPVPAMWEGCRNYTVRNYFRDTMRDGDVAFFYNSNCDPIGIAGTMRIVGDAYPDPTQFDPSNRYFDAKSTPENPRWMTRNVVLIEKYPRIVTLAKLRETPGLEEMQVIRRGQRLSVLPVSENEWQIVVGLSRR